MSEPLEASADKAEPGLTPDEAQDGEAKENDEGSAAPDEIDVLRTENAQLRDEYLRAHADAENARKRAQTEISNARRFALEGFASELLNVRDSLDLARSVDLEGAEGVVERMVEGLELTLRQLDSAFDFLYNLILMTHLLFLAQLHRKLH